MKRDDEITSLLRNLEAKTRGKIEQLGIPSWHQKTKVARVADQRIMVEEYSKFCSGLISSGYFQNGDEPFVFMPPTETEWFPDFPSLDPNWTQWDDFAEALRSGRKKKVAVLAEVLRGLISPPKHILELTADFLQGKNKVPTNRPPNPVCTQPSREMWALKYYERLEPTLRDMFPTQYANAVALRAKQIAAARFKVTVDDLKKLASKSKRRRT
jgi:hypothetical protein